MRPIRLALAVFALVVCLVPMSGTYVAQAAPAPEYAVIYWDDMDRTLVVWPDGRTEFLSTLLPSVAVPSKVDARAYIMTLLINKLTKQGYEYVGMASGEQILMKKVR